MYILKEHDFNSYFISCYVYEDVINMIHDKTNNDDKKRHNVMLTTKVRKHHARNRIQTSHD